MSSSWMSGQIEQLALAPLGVHRATELATRRQSQLAALAHSRLALQDVGGRSERLLDAIAPVRHEGPGDDAVGGDAETSLATVVELPCHDRIEHRLAIRRDCDLPNQLF